MTRILIGAYAAHAVSPREDDRRPLSPDPASPRRGVLRAAVQTLRSRSANPSGDGLEPMRSDGRPVHQ